MTDRTLSEVIRRTGAKKRSLQLWTDAGIVRVAPSTDRAGSGVHRRYEEGEERLIAILAGLAKLNVPIGWLKYFASEFRKRFANEIRSHDHPTVSKNNIRALERASAGIGNNFLLFSHAGTALFFELISVDGDSAPIDLVRYFREGTALGEATGFIGILDLNVCLKGLRE